MKSWRRFESTFVALLFVALSTGVMLAQDDQGSYPPPANAPQQSYPDQAGQQPAYPNQGQPQSYPDQSGQQPPYSGQQQSTPQQGQQAYPDQSGQAGQQQQQDPPGRVARVQYMAGQVSMQPGGVNDWIAATQNRPLTSADRVWTDKNSQAELNVGDGFLRMNSETSVTLTNVTDNNVQIELDQGTLEITVKHLEKGEIYEVDTPNYAFTVMKSGVYRFDVYPNEDQSWVTVRSGYGEATGKGAAVRVNSGEQMRFNGGTSLVHTAMSAPSRDGFDDWVQVRDKRLDDSLSARYVSPGVIGYQDLDGYGRWVPTPNYGNVWIPSTVPAGWAPYRYGHWTWIAPWGWTWVDDQPWGFAPFHYGRWVSYGGYWGWAPGPVGYWNPYYSPALVGWIGGPGFGVGFGFGGGGWGIGINFGWFPLGWGEPFYPRYCGWGYGGWYRGGGWVSNNYVRNVNITNTRITNINNVTNNYYNGGVNNARYGFRNTPGAVTAAPRSAFTSGAAINRVGGAVPKSALGQGTMLHGVDATPTRQSVIGGAAQAHNTPPSSAFNRGVVTANHGGATTNRPANLEAANQATAAHGNMNAFGHGNTGTANVGAANTSATRPAFNGTAQNGHMNTTPTTTQANNGARGANTGVAQPGHVNTPATTQAAHGPVTNGTEARVETPTSMGGHYVPRPPSAGGNPTTRSVPYGGGTPGSNNTYSHAGAANSGYGNSNQQSAMNGNQQRYGTTNPNVARPPQTYQPGHANTAPQSASPSHGSTPGNYAPKGNSGGSSGGSKSGNGSSHGSGMAMSAPHPPANYNYHAAPTYSASANYGGASRQYGTSYGNTGRTYSPSSSYSAGRSNGSTPNYSAQRSYGSTPSYSNHSAVSSPTYSARSYGSSPSNRSSYSAPHYSGGGGSSSHGGGSSGGGHSSGSGGHR
jgi:hypothetical protein